MDAQGATGAQGLVQRRAGLRVDSLTGSGSGVPADADVIAYAAAVATAGSALPPAHQAALNTAWAAAKSAAPGMRAKIKEMHFPCGLDGDQTAALVKFINGATAPSLTHTGMLTTDYTVALGIDLGASNSTKKLFTDFNPSVHGSLTAGNWGVSTFSTRNMVGTAAMMFGAQTGTAFYLGYAGTNGQSKIGGASAMALTPLGGASEEFRAKFQMTVQINGGTGQCYYGGWLKNSVVQSSPTLPNSALCPMGGPTFFANHASSGYVIHSPMTPAELIALQTFFTTACTAIGRTMFTETLNAIGDSYVAAAPVGPSVPANDWVAIAATVKGWSYNLAGTSGIGWGTGSSAMSDTSGLTGQNKVFAWMLQKPAKRVIFPLGINDADHAGTTAAATTEMHAVLDMITALGYPMAYVRLATPCQASEVVDQTLLSSMAQAVRDAGTAYGLPVCDFYAGRTNGQLSMETSDHLHKNDSGHIAMAADFADHIAATPW